jgi:hypothetical protein
MEGWRKSAGLGLRRSTSFMGQSSTGGLPGRNMPFLAQKLPCVLAYPSTHIAAALLDMSHFGCGA